MKKNQNQIILVNNIPCNIIKEGVLYRLYVRFVDLMPARYWADSRDTILICLN